ncbi:MAG: M14 family metallopeptidase [Burkholderiales bacterium]|nr:M14 family metallopeptidase [Burkholderiales bacterium]
MAFDRYLRHPDLTDALHALVEQRPDLFSIASIGRSHEGRDVWLVTATRVATGAAEDKPAVWVDGNIHATEVAASMACLWFLQTLARDDGVDADVTRALDTRVFFVCPRINPDGAELALADTPRWIRSSTRPYPYDEAPIGGLRRHDIDGDGRVLTMRVRDPDGPWKVSDRDARLLVRRDPAETGGEYFRLLPEGTIDDFDGATIRLQTTREQLDLNRNFPSHWRQEHEQFGAGPYPASEPEVRAVVDFVAAHPNICCGVAFHTYSGVLLRPFSHSADDEMAVEDLRTYQTIGEKGTALTGYPAISVFHEFRYHPKDVITGSFDDWLYDHRGAFAWTVEIWSPQREAGIGDYKYIDWYRTHPVDDDLKLLAWNDTVLEGRGFVPWRPFVHPQLGEVEIGGWDALFTWSNPPPALLAREVDRFPRWLVWQALITPRLEVHTTQVTRLSPDTWQLRVVLRNSGWLPTYVTKLALKNKLVRGVIAELTLPDGVTLVQGDARHDAGQLEGRAYKPGTASAWAAWGGDVTDERVKIEWIVRGAAGACIDVTARHERAGCVRLALELTA